MSFLSINLSWHISRKTKVIDTKFFTLTYRSLELVFSIYFFENSKNIQFLAKGSIYNVFTQTLCNGKNGTQRQFFQWGITGLNSEFSFSWTGCHTNAKELSLPYYLPIAREREKRWIHAFPKGMSAKGKYKKSHPKFQLWPLS